MNNFVVLFRGINVGGKNLIPMKELVAQLTLVGYQNVSFYIQSGNIVLTSAEKTTKKLALNIEKVVTQQFGFSPEVFVIESTLFAHIAAQNPYAQFEGKWVHFYFCTNKIDINETNIKRYISASEAYTVIKNVFYLHAPDGIGRSKLVANIEACLGQAATGRNLNTVNKISAILDTIK